MRTMQIVIVAFTLAIGTLVNASAIAQSVPYSDAIKTCGAEWKISDVRKTTAKGEGRAAWQLFRAECVARVGYVPTRRTVTVK